ncbi:MAG: zinc-dependent metalloprotease [Bacteroidota bacterium]
MRKIYSLAILSIIVSSCATKKPPVAANAAPAPKTVSIADKTKSCKKIDGLFPLYQDTLTGNVLMLIKKDQLNKEYIYFSYTEDGVVAAGHHRGSFRDNKVFTIKRYFDKIEFVVQNTGYYFDTLNPISKSAKANISPAILVNQKIMAEDAKKGEILLDASTIFLSESMCQVKPSPFFGLPPGMQMFSLGGLSRDKTKFTSLKNYEKNTDLVVEYVYDNPSPMAAGGKEVTDERAVSIVLQHSLIEAPKNNFKPRFDDPRIGYFSEQVEDMTTTNAVAYRDLIHRWNLEKKDPNAALSEPVTPIVWWIENTTPKEFRATIKEAGEKWNLAFEAAGFKNAVVVKEQPDTATWDAGDIRYNVLRWTSSPQPPFGGYGPSFVDPRTGEILGADIMLEYIFITNRLRQEDLFDAATGMQNPLNPNKHTFCDASNQLHQTSLFGLNALQLQGLNEIEKRDYIKQSLYYLVLHEMGHTMGLNHNMKASQMLKPNQLNDKNITRKIGLTASVMDYPAVNVALDKSKQGDYFTTCPGPYDNWAIEFGYSAAVNDEAKEKERLAKILSRSADTLLIFGNDADDMRGFGSGIDPRINVNDMSGDAITFGIDRIKLANQLFAKIKEKYSKPGQSYQELRQAYGIAQSEYFSQVNVIARYIGGVYVDRSFIGQTGATKPLIPVDYKEQKRAMETLGKYAFAPDAFAVQNDLYNYLQLQRRGFNFFGTNEDPKVHARILGYQSMLLMHLLNPTTLKRLTDSKLYGNKYSALEMMNDLTKACFATDASNPNTFRQNLQNAYTENLISLFKSSRYDAVSQAAALAQLKQIATTCKGGSTEEAKAHYANLKLKIDQALTEK